MNESFPNIHNTNINEGENVNTIPQAIQEYFFSSVLSSRDQALAKKFLKKYVIPGKVNFTFIDSPENIEEIKNFLSQQRMFKDNVDGIIEEFKLSGLITEPVIEIEEKKVEEKPEPEHIKTQYQHLQGIKESKADISEEELQKNIKTEKIKNLSKERIQELSKRFEDKKTTEWDYYDEFVQAGFVSEEEARRDFEKTQELKSKFNQENYDEKTKERLAFAKQIAIITEKGIEVLVEKAKVFGEDISIKNTSEFTDINRGIDSIVEITKQDGDMDFIGIATDITFRRIEEVAFDEKFFSILRQIKKGWKATAKYEKNSRGELMKEFVVPKTLLHLNMDDVRLCGNVLEASRNKDESELKEEFKNNERSTHHLQQIFFQCKLLSKYARENKNSIFREYNKGFNAFIELSWKNPEIKKALESEIDKKFKNKLESLIIEFENDPRLWD